MGAVASAFSGLLVIFIVGCWAITLYIVCVALPMRMYADMKAWRDDGALPAKPPKPRETFICKGCGSGPWDIAWDPHEQPVMGRRGGRICPNCSGAD